MKIVSIINQKGGVGKTTNTIHIGAYLANKGHRVLLVDLDPQCDLSHGCGIKLGGGYNLVDFLKGEGDFEIHSIQNNMYLLEGDKFFIASKFKKQALKKQLNKVEEYFDFVLIDCPPTTINFVDTVPGDLALTASNYFLVPIEADEYPIKNLNVFLGSVFKLIEEENLNLDLIGVFFSNVLVTKSSFEYYSNILKENGIGDYLFKAKIRQDSMVQKAVITGKTIFDFKPNSRAALDFEKLGSEILERINKGVYE